MTPRARRGIVLVIVTGVLVGVLGPVLLGAGRGVWDAKVSTTRYELDRQRDSLWRNEQRSMTLDVLCSPNVDPDNRRCKQ
ncbi:MAG TPA: hypothetical protein VFM71_01470 [Gemmatimonadaceae bacterium]|nr:hypothetical protein [Gemmatimonadaceae bacterium]